MTSPWRLAVAGFLLWCVWLGVSPLPLPDRICYDANLRLLRRLRPAVSPTIVHLSADMDQGQPRTWNSYAEEFNWLAGLIDGVRAQGASVIMLDFFVTRGVDADYAALWKQLQPDVVLAWEEGHSTRLPPGAELDRGLVRADADWDGLLRRHSFYGWRGGKAYPSLPLAAYLRWREAEWIPPPDPSAGPLRLRDVNAKGDPVERVIPREVYLDMRAPLDEPGGRDFRKIEAATLRDWKARRLHNQLEGCVVVIGYTSPGSGDVGSTPMDRVFPKVYLLSMALNALEQGSWRVPAPRSLTAIFGAALVLVGTLLAGRLGGLRLLTLWLSGCALLEILAALAFLRTHWIPLPASLAALWTGALVLERWRQAALRSQRALALQAGADMDDPYIEKVVGPYQLVERIGQGGFASVYRALPQATLDPEKAVAVKIIHGQMSQTGDFRQRFLREIRISEQLQHESIVRVLGGGDQNGMLYMVMELLKGKSLRFFTEERSKAVGTPRWSTPEAIGLLRPMLAGVAYAHSLHVVHRDLKPENMMVEMGSPPRLKIVDFGLAFDQECSRLTKTDELFGTIEYLAPERIQGVKDDPASDQYALGLIAYELLTGESAFPSGSTAETLLFRLVQEPRPLRERCPEVSPALAAVIHRMIVRDPRERFPDVASALEALEEAFAGGKAKA